AFQIFACYFGFQSLRRWRRLPGPMVLITYLTALGSLSLGYPYPADWYPSLTQAVLLLIALAFFGFLVLADSGALERRHAQMLADRLANRKSWPEDLESCRLLPEVKALREAIHNDASSALALLGHSSTQVKVAALAALEFRKHWRVGEAELVLEVAAQS